MGSEQPHGPVLGLAYSIAEVSKVPVERIAGYVVLVVNLDGKVGTIAAGISREAQIQACSNAIATFISNPVPDAVVADPT